MSSAAVLDASALLAVLHGETGFDMVMPHLRGGLVSAVNYSEVLKKAVERGLELTPTRWQLAKFNLTIIPFDEAHAIRAAEIWHECKPYGLSAADRACISLGLIRDLTVITADMRMQDVELGVNVVLIREHKGKKVKA